MFNNLHIYKNKITKTKKSFVQQKKQSYTPKLSKGSEKIVSQKMNQVYQTHKNYEDFLINKGKIAKQKKEELKKFFEKEQIKDCTFKPEINRVTKSKSSISVFENLYKRAETYRQSSRDSARRHKSRETERL